MRLKEYFRNTVNLILGFILIANLTGCTSFFDLYPLDTVPERVEKILNDTYHIKATARVVGKTLWVYVPLSFSLLNLSSKQIRERFKKVLDDVQSTIFRVLINSQPGIEFYASLLADTTSGIVFYIVGKTDDLKSYFFERISIDEIAKRKLFNHTVFPAIIGDQEGKNFNYFDISLPQFLCALVIQRVKEDLNDNDLSLDWQIVEASEGKIIPTFQVETDDEKVISTLKKEIIHTFRAYRFKKPILYILIQTPLRTISILKEDIFENTTTPKKSRS